MADPGDDPQHDVESQAGRVRGVGQGNVDHRGLRLPTAIGFGCLTLNSCLAIYRSNGDPESIAFVAFSYADLVLLFHCLRPFEPTAPSSPRRGRVKAAVWALTTLLTVMFAYKVAAMMPFPVAVVVWAMAATTVAGGFCAFFLH